MLRIHGNAVLLMQLSYRALRAPDEFQLNCLCGLSTRASQQAEQKESLIP
jgi:hypothetical protein